MASDWRDAIYKFEQAAAFKKAVMEGRNPKRPDADLNKVFNMFFNPEFVQCNANVGRNDETSVY